jgi:hypothetical protein
MKKLILILVAAAALFGAWYLGKTTGKDCCKEESTSSKKVALDQSCKDLDDDDFIDGKCSRLRILNIFSFEDTELDLANYKYTLKVNEYDEEDLEIKKQYKNYYASLVQTFRKKGSTDNPQRTDGKGDYKLDYGKTYINRFTIFKINKKDESKREVIYSDSNAPGFKGKTLKDMKTNLVFQFVPVPKTPIITQEGEGGPKPLQNPPIGAAGSGPGPG